MNQWEQVIDPVSGRLYYANRFTGETSWSPPVVPPCFPFPPPPSNTPSFAPAADLQQQQQQQQKQIQPSNAQQNTSLNNLQSSYQFDSSTTTTQGLLVPSIRAVIEKEQAQPATSGKLELVGVAAGTIADLSNVSREWRTRNLQVDGGDFAAEQHPTTTPIQKGSQNTSVSGEDANQYYKPLQPFSLPLQARPPHVEPGRLEMRLQSLYNKLQSL